MGVPLKKKRDSDGYDTDRDALAALAEEYEICKRITEWREYSKMRTAFGDAVTGYMDKNNRLHPEYNQLVSTGRMSARNPNVQQVPANKLGNELRKCFIAPPGRKLVAADYSQIELRILAELTGEPNLLKAFEEGVDLHSLTASVMFGVDLDEMLLVLDSEPEDEAGRARKQELKELRRKAKAVNFGIPYGQGPGGLSMKERIPLKEAEAYIRAYFEANPRVQEWLDKNGGESFERLYAETMLGRKRFFPRIQASGREYERLKRGYKRQMNNHPIQGTSADITKLAVYKIHKAFKDTTTVPILFVHDEIVLETDEDKAEEVLEILVREMAEAARYFLKVVPVKVEGKISSYWEH
jgi:DNA polymerase-1